MVGRAVEVSCCAVGVVADKSREGIGGMRGFVMWEVQTLKWLKLDLLEQRLMSMKVSGSAGHKQLIRIVNSFSSRLEEARESVEIEIASVLRRLGADVSSEDVVTVASDGTAPKSSSPSTLR